MQVGSGDGVDALQLSLRELREQRWASGKEVVKAIKAFASTEGKRAIVDKKDGTFRSLRCSAGATCGWSINVSVMRRKAQSNYWHVTTGNLNHMNCIGTAKPTVQQLASSTVLRTAVAADPSVSASTLERQLQLNANFVCGRTMVYRAKQQVLRDVYSENLQTIKYLPCYLSAFAARNPGTLVNLERDTVGHFLRAMVSLDPAWFSHGLTLFSVNVAHMKQRKYNGVQIVLVARDGNLQNRVAAVALAPIEDHLTYLWFFRALLSHGFPLRNVPVFCDRHTGIILASKELQVFTMFCTRHIIGNMRADKTVRLAVGHEAMVWRAQAAEIQALYQEAIDDLHEVNPCAGIYLSTIPAAKWALHLHYNNRPLFGWRTTNFVESEQVKSQRLKPRLMLPYEYFRAYINIMMAEAYCRLQQGKAWIEAGRITTPRAENKFQCELRQTPQYVVSFSSATVAYTTRIGHPDKPRRVDISGPSCTCTMWLQQGLPCKHLLAVLKRCGGLEGTMNMFASCYTVTQYVQDQRPIELPDDSQLIADSTLLPARFHRQAGCPRKRRIRSRGERGHQERARKVYK